jgi:hypothetical protein
MHERLRKIVYTVGKVVILIMTPIFILYVLVSAFFNITDAPTGSSADLIGLAVYGVLVFLFFTLMKKPFGSEYSFTDRFRLLLMYGFILFVFFMIIVLAVVIILFAVGG